MSGETHDDPTVSHARAREDADELLDRARRLSLDLGRTPNPRERFWFILEARKDDLYVRGESSALLAEVWGLGTNAVERSACEVQNVLVDPAGVERAREWIALESRRRSEELWERARQANDRDAAPLAQASGAELERHGKVTGAIQSGPTLSVHIDARGQLKPETGAMLVAACETAAAMGLDPRAFRDALAGRLASSLPTAAVMALPAPACASPADRARELVAALCEVMPEVDDPSEVRPALLAMVADDE